MIPKIIHIVWIGDESKKPNKEINSWKLPDYELKIWSNESLSQCWKLKHHMDYYWPIEKAGVADCMRWEILYQYGGIAIDADAECIRPLEDWLLEPSIFACWENELTRPGLVANGVVGAAPNNTLIDLIIKDLQIELPNNRLAWKFCGPQRLTDTIHKYQYRNITIYPSHYFFPEHFTKNIYTGSGQVFAKQGWKSSLCLW